MAVFGTAIDAGQNFLTGKVTSALQTSGAIKLASDGMDKLTAVQNLAHSTVEEAKNGVMTEVAFIGNAAGSIVGDLYGTSMAALGDLTQCADLAKLAVEHVITYSAQLVTDKMMDFVSSIPGDITSATTSYMTKMLDSKKKEVMELLTSNVEERNEKKQEEDKENKINKFISDAKDGMESAKKAVNEFVEGLNGDVAELTDLMSAGPEYIANQVDKLENSAISYVGTFVNKQVDALNKKKMGFINSAAESAANKMANEVIDPMFQQLKKAKDEVDQATSKTKQKAMAKIKKAAMKYGGQIGIDPTSMF